METKRIYSPEQLVPFTAIHPGEMLKDELESRNISQRKFASIIDCSYSVLNEILNGKRPINTEYALKIEAATGIKAYIWLDLQSDYNLQTAKANNKLIIVLNRIRQSVAVL